MEDQIDWNDLFDDTFFDPSSVLPTSSPDHVNDRFPPLSIHDVEQLLLKDNDDIPLPTGTGGDAFNDGFFHDILLDSPLEDGERSGEVVDVSSDGDNSIDDHKNKAVDDQKNEEDHKEEEKQNSDDDPNDPLAKKRKRQLRNKDAALKSRERKKMYVKDLEMKSRYYEGECRRLGSLLQYFMAENQALRFSLHISSNKVAYNASMTKQESAVLLLESLLLGSLLWLIGNVCQLVLHHPNPLLQVVVGEEEQAPPSPSPRLDLNLVLVGSKRCGESFLLVGKGYKASRSRMRMPISITGMLVF